MTSQRVKVVVILIGLCQLITVACGLELVRRGTMPHADMAHTRPTYYEEDNSILIFGGYYGCSAESCFDGVYRYDLLTENVTRVGSFPHGVYSGGIGEGINGSQIYYFGGSHTPMYGIYIDTVFVAESSDPQPTPIGQLPTILANHATVDDGQGNIYVIGGQTEGIVGPISSEILRYDIVANTFEVIGNMPMPRMYHTAAIVDGAIYVFGGQYSNTKDIYKFNLGTLETSVVGVTDWLYGAYAVAVGTNIYVVGGGATYSTVSNLIKYDTITQTIEQFDFPELDDGFSFCSAVYIESLNRIYIIGGDTPLFRDEAIYSIDLS